MGLKHFELFCRPFWMGFSVREVKVREIISFCHSYKYEVSSVLTCVWSSLLLNLGALSHFEFPQFCDTPQGMPRTMGMENCSGSIQSKAPATLEFHVATKALIGPNNMFSVIAPSSF